MKRKLFGFVAAALLVLSLALTACDSRTKFELEDYSDKVIEYKDFEFSAYTGKLIVDDSRGYKLFDLEIICSDETVAVSFTGTYASDGYRYLVKPRYNGEFEIYIQTKDGAVKTGKRKFTAVGGEDRPAAE